MRRSASTSKTLRSGASEFEELLTLIFTRILQNQKAISSNLFFQASYKWRGPRREMQTQPYNVVKGFNHTVLGSGSGDLRL
jgi:hypothetical protein